MATITERGADQIQQVINEASSLLTQLQTYLDMYQQQYDDTVARRDALQAFLDDATIEG